MSCDTRSETSSFNTRRCGVGRPPHLLDHLHLRAVGSLEETDVAAVVGRHFFEDVHAVGLQLGQSPRIIVGLDRDVLDAIMLLVVLAGDQCRDVELQPVQIEAKAAAGNFGLHGRAEVVDVELRRLLGIAGLYVHMLDGIGHGHSPSRG